MHHRRSCPYHVPPPKRFNSDSKAWMGPVFANEKNSGWNKLNAVKACTRCRDRHVRCSLRTSGGPCNHCRKRKEVCVVLGWEMQPDDPANVIYKPVLPPPMIPSATPIEPSNHAVSYSTPINAEELAGRLEKLSPRALALLWPWGPDDRDPFYPSGPQFGDDYHEHCSEDCPNRNRIAGNTAHYSYSPTIQSPSLLRTSGASPAATTSSYIYLPSSPQWEMVEDNLLPVAYLYTT
ncbi:uncharacterized protein MELLADRAFT_118048 [Melampsora larici-populina 98AG31]|uniref:Zn(2)-C6 fungal-type domain-containing protein n=1 Tax=Melampsora larici-populina (strain 98AG31 / pathotype 3-4-7) TaxID=747676 RepID=F4S4N8_MELLP|nr:uncharacterized protein MELLADRAFT_118048 [Melampsora larici-populina 98AG31]EGG00319.1 hypothetical protein MELLADRAFT_118048 [Melampsora larici-populina 98AG31]